MQCLLLGLSPCTADLWERLQQVRRVDNDEQLVWKEHSTITTTTTTDDDDNDDGTSTSTTTLLATAWTTLDANVVVAHVQTLLEQVATVELWASAPAPLPLRPAQGYNVHCNNLLDSATLRTLQQWGLVIQQQQLLTANQVNELRAMTDDAIATVETKLRTHRPHLNIGQDTLLFDNIASRNLQRFDLRLNEVEEIRQFVQTHIVDQPAVTAFVDAVLGPPCAVFDVSVVYSRPGACAQNWHADGDHVKGATDAGWRDNDDDNNGWQTTTLARPYALCLFVPLIDLNDTVGYTQFWPGSHRWRALVGFGPVAALTAATVNAVVPAGGAVWYDYRLLHRGMPNKASSSSSSSSTKDTTTRPILQVVFRKPWYVERANYGTESIA